MADKDTTPAKLFWLQSSPHIVRADDTAKIMSRVILSLLPVTVFGIIIFGISALLNVVVSVACAVIGEALFRRITKQDIRIKDYSAVVTGLLLALVLPPSTPLWMTAIGALFAVIIAKEFFGGLGANVFNPALTGRAFLLMSFGTAITSWIPASGPWTKFFQLYQPVDGVTVATPLNYVKMGTGTIADYAQQLGGAASDFGVVMQHLFLGTRAGCIGETSILLILIGAIFLLVTKTIDWRAPVGMLLSAAVLGGALGKAPFCDSVLFTLMSGGLLFGAVFMTTDYTTTPVTAWGKFIFGLGAGIIVVLIRQFGNYPEGVMFSILIMNMATPFLNRILRPKYGAAKSKGGAK
jgi:electron transport complex protein RnfD